MAAVRRWGNDSLRRARRLRLLSRHRHRRSRNPRQDTPGRNDHQTGVQPADRCRHSSIANRRAVLKIQPQEDRPMKLFTEKQRTTLLANGAQRGADHVPVVKLFNPCGSATWLLTELDPEYQDECGFGLADLGFGTPELGSVGLCSIVRLPGAVRPRHRTRSSLYGNVPAFHLRRGRACRRAYRRNRARTGSRRPKPCGPCGGRRARRPATGTFHRSPSHGSSSFIQWIQGAVRTCRRSSLRSCVGCCNFHRLRNRRSPASPSRRLCIRGHRREPVARYPDRSLDRFGRQPARLGRSLRRRSRHRRRPHRHDTERGTMSGPNALAGIDTTGTGTRFIPRGHPGAA